MKPNLIIFDQLTSVIAQAAFSASIDAGYQSLSASSSDLTSILSEHDGEIAAVILDHPAHSEGNFNPTNPDIHDINRICDAVRDELTNFLNACRAATKSFMPHKQGAVWSLCIDDFASDLLGGPTAAIASQARIGAIKSLAKEYGRMGITYNVFVCQPPKEFVDEETWKRKREALKVYSLRYKALDADDYGRFLIQVLSTPKAMNGSVVHLGVGMMEMGS